MKITRIQTAGLAIAISLLLGGCGGGGGGDYPVSATVVVPTGPVFDIYGYINGLQLPGFDVLPGDVQTVSIPIGQSFQFTSDSDVTWNVYVNGVEVPSVNSSISVGDVTITETATNSLQFAGYATSPVYLQAPVQVTLIATSLIDYSQTAEIDLVITN